CRPRSGPTRTRDSALRTRCLICVCASSGHLLAVSMTRLAIGTSCARAHPLTHTS
ncbi:hypothetical protein IW143_001873, partial [Coemansia sp. RSA 520]